MSLSIKQVDGKGDARSEKVWLQASAACQLRDYILSDVTFSGGEISNVFRHTYHFPKLMVAAHDWVCLNTRPGTYERKVHPNNRGGSDVVHNLFWGSNAAIWNNTGDSAALFKVALQEIKKVSEVEKR